MKNFKHALLIGVGTALLFAVISSLNAGFQSNRDISSYYMPVLLGFVVGITLGVMKNQLERRNQKKMNCLSLSSVHSARR